MKTRTLLSLITLFIFLPAFTITAQKADISGEWKLNKEKSQVAENLFLSKITLKLKPDSLLTTRVYENQNGEEYSFDEKLSLDNKECKTVIYDMPRTSAATRSNADGSISIASTTTFNGNGGMEDMVAKEAWKLGEDGNLTLDFTNKMSGNELTGKYIYEKVK
jgi:hypothetical protein